MKTSFNINENYAIGNKWQIKKFSDKLKDIACLLLGCTREQLEDREFKEKELGEEWWYWKLERNGVYKSILLPYNEPTGTEDFELIKLTPRLLLQLLGTECGREIIHPNIWVNSLFSDYKPKCAKKDEYIKNDSLETICRKFQNQLLFSKYPNWIITDTRFPNELQAIKDRDGITIRVNRDTEYLKCLKDPVYFVENYLRTNKEEKIELREFDKDFIRKHCTSTKEHESETALDNAEFDYVIDNNSDISSLIENVKGVLIKENIL
jgi:hypothetical protein